MLPQFKELDKMVQNAKRQFEKYITDPNIPLETRWSDFLDAPSYVKNYGDYIPEFDCLNDNRFILEHDVVFCWEKREEQDIEDFVRTLEDPHTRKEFPDITDELILTIKEEILKANMASFVWDW